MRDKTTTDIINVLVVEDDPLDVRLIQAMLSRIMGLKFTIESASHLTLGLSLLRDKTFDVVLLDLSLPDARQLEGFYVISKEFPDLPIIILTGLDDENLAMTAINQGAQDYLLKGTIEGKLLSQSIKYAIERKKAEKLKYEIEARRIQFITMVSHELRSPILVIRGYIDFIEQLCERSSTNQIVACLPSLKRNLLRLETLTKGVNDISKLELDMFHMDFQEFFFDKFIQDVTKPYKDILHHQLEIQVLGNMANIIVKGDPLRLQQIIDNLVDNAIRNTSKSDRRIKLKISLSLHKIEIQVSDNGAGIAPQNLESIFEQFLSIPTEYSVGGSGIGLYISREIAEAHHGSLIAKSEGLGKGSRFILEIPKTFK